MWLCFHCRQPGTRNRGYDAVPDEDSFYLLKDGRWMEFLFKKKKNPPQKKHKKTKWHRAGISPSSAPPTSIPQRWIWIHIHSQTCENLPSSCVLQTSFPKSGYTMFPRSLGFWFVFYFDCGPSGAASSGSLPSSKDLEVKDALWWVTRLSALCEITKAWFAPGAKTRSKIWAFHKSEKSQPHFSDLT